MLKISDLKVGDTVCFKPTRQNYPVIGIGEDFFVVRNNRKEPYLVNIHVLSSYTKSPPKIKIWLSVFEFQTAGRVFSLSGIIESEVPIKWDNAKLLYHGCVEVEEGEGV